MPAYGSPEWWLAYLEQRLSDRQARLKTYENYYTGAHPLQFATSKFREVFGRLLDTVADNWMEIIVSAVVERLRIQGFRFGEPDGDQQAWEIWQRNSLDADSDIAHTEALINGECSILVGPDEDNRERARITVEHPRQVVCAYAPTNRRQRVAALKKWIDVDGYAKCTLYLPAWIYKFRSKNQVPPDWAGDQIDWTAREPEGEPWPLRNPLGVVPVIPLINRPRINGVGESELARAIPIQDAINKLVGDLLVASELYAFRARWATGLDIPLDPTTGKPVEPFTIALNRVWTSKDPNTQFGEFGQTDLTNFTKAIETFVQHIASQSRTPPHYFYLSTQFPSGEALKSAEAGLVAKARNRARQFGESWEEAMRLAFQLEGNQERARMIQAETIWGDFETRTETAHADYLIKLKALGVPDAQLWEDAGFSPQQIARFPALRELFGTQDATATEPFTANGNGQGREPIAGGV